ncbi:hypothetical protein F511_38454 [Dorcoceras hygrometricum]|uniref:Uncharacterized protein n=1 Tax=Dorcoceras hygrometricum TaxID=472368 RepID=A0A2Z7B422_9LAMI|nr:hypothetical protein F511_38454 [Dorcoceras hygrometricum]
MWGGGCAHMPARVLHVVRTVRAPSCETCMHGYRPAGSKPFRALRVGRVLCCRTAPGSDQSHKEIDTSAVEQLRPPNPIHDRNLLAGMVGIYSVDDGRRRRDGREDTASRGLTTFVTPKPHFQTNPSDHGKASSNIAPYTLGITDSACKNDSLMVSIQYGPFKSNIPIRSTTIDKSRVARDPITMNTSWRSNSDIACVTRSFYIESTRTHKPQVASWAPTLTVGSVVDLAVDPTAFVGVFRRGPDVQIITSDSSSSSSSSQSDPISPHDSSSRHIPITFVDDTAQTSMPSASVTAPDYTEPFARLRTSVDNISHEQMQSRFHVEKLKADISKRILHLETALIAASESHDRAVLIQTDILRKEMKEQKAALSREMNDELKGVQDQQAALSHDLMDLRVKAQENFNTLTSQLSELFDYINRGGDAKKGESSSSRGPQPPPDDRGRPGSGDGGFRPREGSRSGSSSKRYYRSGGSHKGSGRGIGYWLADLVLVMEDSDLEKVVGADLRVKDITEVVDLTKDQEEALDTG